MKCKKICLHIFKISNNKLWFNIDLPDTVGNLKETVQELKNNFEPKCQQTIPLKVHTSPARSALAELLLISDTPRIRPSGLPSVVASSTSADENHDKVSFIDNCLVCM